MVACYYCKKPALCSSTGRHGVSGLNTKSSSTTATHYHSPPLPQPPFATTTTIIIIRTRRSTEEIFFHISEYITEDKERGACLSEICLYRLMKGKGTGIRPVRIIIIIIVIAASFSSQTCVQLSAFNALIARKRKQPLDRHAYAFGSSGAITNSRTAYKILPPLLFW